MKKIKIAIIICVIMIIAIVFFIISTDKKNEQNNNLEVIENNINVQLLKDNRMFYTITNCINKYVSFISSNNPSIAYYLLDKQYIENNNINKNNISNKIETFSNYMIFSNESVYYIDDEELGIYVAFGNIKEDGTDTSKQYSITVKLDKNNNTFSINPSKYTSNQELNSEELYKMLSTIEKNTYNEFSYSTISSADILNNYISILQVDVAINKQKVFELLDTQYKNEKFIDFEDFNNYLNYKMQEIFDFNIEEYVVNHTPNYIEYIAIDKNNNSYTFYETSPMNYYIMLDSYTVDNNEFVKKYNSTTKQGKVALNIDKFIQAINSKDYKYAYNCLADSYKNNYFKTQEEFENYAKENFYEINTIGYKEFNIKDDIYTYSVLLTDKQTGEQKNKTFIMQLKEGTEFVLSFDR